MLNLPTLPAGNVHVVSHTHTLLGWWNWKDSVQEIYAVYDDASRTLFHSQEKAHWGAVFLCDPVLRVHWLMCVYTLQGYDISFLITNFHTEQMYKHKLVDFVVQVGASSSHPLCLLFTASLSLSVYGGHWQGDQWDEDLTQRTGTYCRRRVS